VRGTDELRGRADRGGREAIVGVGDGDGGDEEGDEDVEDGGRRRGPRGAASARQAKAKAEKGRVGNVPG
jgi:hypothetical protein